MTAIMPPEAMRQVNKDLRTAIEFVVGRIEQEAARRGEPLDDEQRFLLTELPSTASETVYGFGWHGSPNMFPVRDYVYESLCELAKDAYRRDRESGAEVGAGWEFAAAVLKMNRHPMVWLLQWAGVKERRPWWDRSMLIAAGLLPVLCLGVTASLWSRDDDGVIAVIAVIAFSVLVIAAMLVASRRLERRRLLRRIEELRGESLAGDAPF